MRIATVFLALALAFALALVAHSTQAQNRRAETEARSVFDAGQVAFTDGRYNDALVYFRRSYNLSHRPALLFNIALCSDRLRDDEAAIEAYERYLAEVPSASNREEVDGRLEALQRAQRRRAAAVEPAHVAQAAEAMPTPTPTMVATAPPAEASPAVYETWWFWTIVGAVVVGGAVGIGVAASGDAPLETGSVGGVVFTLGVAR